MYFLHNPYNVLKTYKIYLSILGVFLKSCLVNSSYLESCKTLIQIPPNQLKRLKKVHSAPNKAISPECCISGEENLKLIKLPKKLNILICVDKKDIFNKQNVQFKTRYSSKEHLR